jgi:outer membrane protein assembly factor BamB
VPSPLVYQGTVYFLNNGGILRTLNAQSGELVKEGRLGNAIDNYYASPVAADGKVYFVGETGKLAVVQAGGQWEVLATGDLGEDCYATPAIVDGSIYLRTGKALYCFRKSE